MPIVSASRRSSVERCHSPRSHWSYSLTNCRSIGRSAGVQFAENQALNHVLHADLEAGSSPSGGDGVGPRQCSDSAAVHSPRPSETRLRRSSFSFGVGPRPAISSKPPDSQTHTFGESRREAIPGHVFHDPDAAPLPLMTSCSSPASPSLAFASGRVIATIRVESRSVPLSPRSRRR